MKIGFVCPSHIASRERHRQSISVLESLGFEVKLGDNVYKDTYGYLASERERADDFNNMILDDSVDMILFGGGEGGNELLPYLNYENIRTYPKLICSFSDGTTILNAIHAITGLTTYYGQGPGMFNDLRYYDYMQFRTHFIDKNVSEFTHNSEWKTLNAGKATGKLIGGYTRNFAMILGNSKYFKYDTQEKYILFLEDHEKFSSVAEVSSYISHIEQSEFIDNVTGLIFGHYSENVPTDLLNRLTRFGEKYNVPVIYTDDFGHGVNHAIFPIGVNAEFDSVNHKLRFI
jgi:Uncharacterized proteins, homologs of microcin C7 resistance protein MccF